MSALTGIVQSALGVSSIAAGIGGEIAGGIASTTGIGAVAGVPVMVVSGSAVAAGTAQLA